MVDTRHLLDDEAMQRFIIDGYVTLHSELPDEFHARMYDALEPLEEGGPRGHNNLLPCVPELQRMLDEPAVVGALESILGPDYYLHFHRHDHTNFPDSEQPLHKDGDNHSHIMVDGRRQHPTRYAMLFYYPQDTPLEAGPTGVVPRSQYLPRRDVEVVRADLQKLSAGIGEEVRAEIEAGVITLDRRPHRAVEKQKLLLQANPELVARLEAVDAPWEAAKIPLTGPAGTITIVHFDIVHGRFSANELGVPRHMVKFLFTRDTEPTAPSWRHTDGEWRGPDDAQAPIWRYLWDWHRGIPSGDAANATDGVGGIAELATRLQDPDDAKAIAAAYELGAHPDGLDALLETFLNGPAETRSIAAYGFGRAASAAVPRLLDHLSGADAELAVRIIDVLSDIGPRAASAAPLLAEYARDDQPMVRRNAVEAIGMVCQHDERLTDAISSALTDGLTDEDALTRRNAVFAVARLAPRSCTPDVVLRLIDNLHHWHHHVLGWSVEALQRMHDPAATAAVIRYLNTTRWDPSPKSGDRQPTRKAMRK